MDDTELVKKLRQQLGIAPAIPPGPPPVLPLVGENYGLTRKQEARIRAGYSRIFDDPLLQEAWAAIRPAR